MAILHVEKLGGLAGFGGIRARIRSRGKLDMAELSPADRQAIDSLFTTDSVSEPSKAADAFRFRISRVTESGLETIEASEDRVPTAITLCVKDEFV